METALRNLFGHASAVPDEFSSKPRVAATGARPRMPAARAPARPTSSIFIKTGLSG